MDLVPDTPSTAPRSYQAGCDGKERHASEAAAEAALRFYQERGTLRTGNGLHVYGCRFCHQWHIGH